MRLSEKEIDFLEENIPDLVGTATQQAFWQTLASGNNVIIAEDGQLLKVFPDGKREVIKNIGKPKKVKVGQKILIC